MGDIRGFFKKGSAAKKKGGGIGLAAGAKKTSGATTTAEKPARKKASEIVDLDGDDDDDDFVDSFSKGAGSSAKEKRSTDKGKKRAGGRAATAKKKAESGKKRKRVLEDDEDEDYNVGGGDEVEEVEIEPTVTKKKRRVSTKAGTAGTEKNDVEVDGEDADGAKSKDTKKKSAYNAWKSRGKPPKAGMKPLPKGAENCLAGKTFVITGVLDSLEREDAQDLIKEYGGRVVSGVSKKVTHAVVGTDAGEKKLAKIEQNNTPIIDEDELFKMISKTYKGPPINDHPAEAMEVDGTNAASVSPSKAAFSASIRPVPRKSAAELGGSSMGAELWVDKYKPKTEKDLCANPTHMKTLTNWLTTWKQKFLSGTSKDKPGTSKGQKGSKGKKGKNDEGFRAVLLAGPPGVGKTTFAHIVAKAAGYEPHELNASDARNKKIVAHLAGEITLAYSISKYLKISDSPSDSRSKKGRKANKNVDNVQYPNGQVLIMDEVDGMSSGDRGGMQELIKVIKDTKVPIICICNDDNSQKVRSLANHCLKLKFRRPMVSQVVKRLSMIAQREGFRAINKQTFEKIAESCHGDIRQMINLLQSWRSSSSQLSFSDAKQRLNTEGKTFEDISVFEVASSLFRGSQPISDRLDAYFVDSDLLPLFVQDAYITSNVAAQSLETLAEAAESISDGDLCSSILREQQRWDLMPSHGLLSTVLPSRLAPGLAGRINFPQWLGKQSSARKSRRLTMELDLHTKATTLCASPRAFRLDYVPALTRRLVTPQLLKKQDGIPEVIEIMETYYMTKLDYDTLLELGAFRKNESPQENIDSKVKATLTRMYKAGEHRIGEANAAHFGKKAPGWAAAGAAAKRDGALDIADGEDDGSLEKESDVEADDDEDMEDLVRQKKPGKKGKTKAATKRGATRKSKK